MKRVFIFSIIITSLLFLLLACSKSGNESKSQRFEVASSPEEVGFDATRLQRIDAFYQSYIDENILPNGISFIAKDGKIVHFKAYGWKDKEAGIAVKKDDIFRLASQTKAIATVGLMILFEKGYCSLNDPVSKFIPEFANPQVLVEVDEKDTTWTTRPAKSEIRIRHLLTHTSGIGDGSHLIYKKAHVFGDRTKMTLQDVIPELGKLPLLHDPGTAWTYGTSLDVAGYIIELLSGESLDDYLRTEIFEPLDMQNTFYNIPEEKKDRLVKLYQKQGPDDPLHLCKWGQEARNVTYFSGSGGLYGTIEDYAKFCQMLLNQGEFNRNRILSRKTIEMMSRNQIDTLLLWNGDKGGYGFQIFTESSLKNYLGSLGSIRWAGAYNTDYVIDPKENLIYVTFTNVTSMDYYRDINYFFIYRDLLYQALE
jgi:CubicO group peptidase (beta-lactamase class C family)